MNIYLFFSWVHFTEDSWNSLVNKVPVASELIATLNEVLNHIE